MHSATTGEGAVTFLTNANGVTLTQKKGSHAKCTNAICAWGASLIVAPPIMSPQHEKGNPIIVCEDHFVHAYWYKDLTVGKQKKQCRTSDFE